jgi:rRNA-processing protein FCF1
MDEQGRTTSSDQPILYVLDTNVLIHDPNALLNFEEHHVAIPMTVLEELDKLKDGKQSVAAECRQAIRLIDKTLGEASPADVEAGVPIMRVTGNTKGFLSILMDKRPEPSNLLPQNLNDNIIINQLIDLHTRNPDLSVILVTKDINMRLKARACGIAAEDYSTDQLVDDVSLLSRGYHNVTGSFWDRVSKVETRQDHGRTWHRVQLSEALPAVHMNEFIIDEQGHQGRRADDPGPAPGAFAASGSLGAQTTGHLSGPGVVRPARSGHSPGQPVGRRGLGQDHSGVGSCHRADHGHQALPPHHRHPQRAGPGSGNRFSARHRGGKDGAVAGRDHR